MADSDYIPAQMRSVGRPPMNRGVVFLSFNTTSDRPEAAVRLSFTCDEAERMALALLDGVALQRYKATQSEISSLMASRDALAPLGSDGP